MRSREPTREEAKPRRPKSRPGPIPTLGDLAAQISWVWLYCEGLDCRHKAPLRLADPIAQFGGEVTSNILRERTRCTSCGRRGATLRLPSWIGSGAGYARFPMMQA